MSSISPTSSSFELVMFKPMSLLPRSSVGCTATNIPASADNVALGAAEFSVGAGVSVVVAGASVVAGVWAGSVVVWAIAGTDSSVDTPIASRTFCIYNSFFGYPSTGQRGEEGNSSAIRRFKIQNPPDLGGFGRNLYE